MMDHPDHYSFSLFRWSVIAASVDDRTREERGITPLKNDKFVINKSRYDSIDNYLSAEGRKYNDIPLIYDDAIYNQLLEGELGYCEISQICCPTAWMNQSRSCLLFLFVE